MSARSDTTKAYTFSADTSAVFAFVIGGFFGMLWPLILYGLVMMMRSGSNAGQPGNNADAVLSFVDDLMQLGALRYLALAFAMALGFVVTGFVSALVVFVCKHRWRG